jgi:hypothetical protein
MISTMDATVRECMPNGVFTDEVDEWMRRRVVGPYRRSRVILVFV